MLAGNSKKICALLVFTAGCVSAQTRLPQEYYVDYMTDAEGLTLGAYACPQGRVELRGLLEELRPKFDSKLAENRLDDLRGVIDFETPTEIAAKLINREPHVRYLFARRLTTDVLVHGEGGVILVVKPCTKEVVDAVLFAFP